LVWAINCLCITGSLAGHVCHPRFCLVKSSSTGWGQHVRYVTGLKKSDPA
jgi:hypothetical protein